MKFVQNIQIGLILSLYAMAVPAFDSSSTGADGAFNPAATVELQLPPSGIFNFTTINIPSGVIVSFAKNAANTPVILLASGDVVIDGVIRVRGANAASVRDTDLTGDAIPAVGGPGGFDGGHGGYFASGNPGGTGMGPGGGGRGSGVWGASNPGWACGGAGGGFNGMGLGSNNSLNTACINNGGTGGIAYGTATLIPLIGGSGGGGGAGGGNSKPGGAGGGGGGAILIASSGAITINGTINAVGGAGGNTSESGSGGGGSGGAIRLVATTIDGNGVITAVAGVQGFSDFNGNNNGGPGAPGRIRLEAENFLRTAPTTPNFSFGGPNPVFVSNLPRIQITSVAGIPAPGAPTGRNDVVLPQDTPNPITVEFAVTNIPAGGTIILTATPIQGAAVSATSTPIAANGTASASIDLPNGPNLLIARTTFTVTADLGKDFSKYAQGEEVREVRVSYRPDSGSETTFITVSGKEHTWPSDAVAIN